MYPLILAIPADSEGSRCASLNQTLCGSNIPPVYLPCARPCANKQAVSEHWGRWRDGGMEGWLDGRLVDGWVNGRQMVDGWMGR